MILAAVPVKRINYQSSCCIIHAYEPRGSGTFYDFLLGQKGFYS